MHRRLYHYFTLYFDNFHFTSLHFEGSALSAGIAIGIVGDAGINNDRIVGHAKVRANAQQPKLPTPTPTPRQVRLRPRPRPRPPTQLVRRTKKDPSFTRRNLPQLATGRNPNPNPNHIDDEEDKGNVIDPTGK